MSDHIGPYPVNYTLSVLVLLVGIGLILYDVLNNKTRR